jgi:hypothetical protein
MKFSRKEIRQENEALRIMLDAERTIRENAERSLERSRAHIARLGRESKAVTDTLFDAGLIRVSDLNNHTTFIGKTFSPGDMGIDVNLKLILLTDHWSMRMSEVLDGWAERG